MERLTRGRRPLRSQLTRTAKEVEELLLDKDPDQKALQVARDVLEKTVAELETWDGKIMEQLLDDGSSDEVMEEEQKTKEKYKRLYLKAWYDIDQSIEKTVGVTSDAGSVAGDTKKRKFHLPEVKLKSFGGNLKDWLGWWSQFRKIHEDDELHHTDKFQYLSQSMEIGSEAKSIVDSYPQTEGNYEKAVEALCGRFGRQDLQLQVYVRELLSLVIGNVTSAEKLPLSQLCIRLESHLRCLTELNLNQADPATWLFPLVESSLPDETLRAWQRSSQSKTDGSILVPPKSRLDLLMDFIKGEVQCEQQIVLAQQGFLSQPPTAMKGNRFKVKPIAKLGSRIPTAAGLVNLHTSGCGFCGKPHGTDKCFAAKRMPMKDKLRIAREKNLCFQCLLPNHMRRDCKKFVKCSRCFGKHYEVFCPENEAEQRNDARDAREDRSPKSPFAKRKRTEDLQQKTENNLPPRIFHQTSNQCSKAVLLNTLKVLVKDKHGNFVTVRLVGDSGSQRSYVNPSTRKAAESVWMEDEWLQNILFGGAVTPPMKFPKHEVRVYGLNGESASLQLLEKSQITGEICGVPSGPWIRELSSQGINISDVNEGFSDADILIGNDYWGAIRTGRMVKLDCGLVAEETVFGWTLGGPIPSPVSNKITTMTVCSQEIEKLWKLETIGIRDPFTVISAVEEEKEALNHFSATVTRDAEGRYIVSLPWKNNNSDLPSNRRVAEQRLKSTTFKLRKTEKLFDYHKVFVGWEKEGLICRVDDECDEGHYIPHRPVFKQSTTTPVRPVFDASCRQGRNPSLNDCLHKGPNLIELIPSMLIRFGENLIGVTSDIRKAFQMLKVRTEDQPYQRFLWWEDETCMKMLTYQHQRVVFGITSSPFLLGAAIHHLIDSLEDSNLAKKMKFAFYVDNMVTSVSSYHEYEELRKSAVEVMAKAQMDLRQWACSVNKSDVHNFKANNGISSEECCEDKLLPILGLIWNREEDTLSCVIKDFSFNSVTKRNMLSAVAQVFDPMGFLCPAMIFPKMLVQEAWSLKLGWDTRVPEKPEKQFLKWTSELAVLSEVAIPRYAQVSGATLREVHVFVDSSLVAMAAVAFLRTELAGAVAVQFLFAKSRLTPVNKPTIPRAELISCVVGVRVAACIQEALQLNPESFHYWSDSATALTWIRRNGDWGVFVRNRVKEILLSTSPQQWHHVPGNMNPADLPSRGCRPCVLLRSKWWEGPVWLRGPRDGFPNSEPEVNEGEVISEKMKISVLLANVLSPRFSSYRKNIAVWGWVLRFVERCRRKGNENPQTYLSISEMRRAEKVVIKLIQSESFSPSCSDIGGIKVFLDQTGILRVKTRLTNRKDTSDFICPLLLPKSHPLVDMLIMDVHRYHSHGGVQFVTTKLREKYWVINSRRVVRKVVHRCVQCSRHASKRIEVEPSSLPAGRVGDSLPFSTTGVDLAGPLFLKDGQKAWIVVYTCALFRAVHLDVVCSLSTEAFLRSLERFIAMYGRPNTVYSDNGTNFVGAANLFKRINWGEVKQQCNVQQIQWIFNPPTAAWWGGWWERIVRSVKDLLKRMLGRSKLTLDELNTCLAGVGATINDRPLTLISEDDEDLVALTPSMFIRPQMCGDFPELVGSDQLRRSYNVMKEMQLKLQHRFRKEYLSQLVTRSGKKQQQSIVNGDVVLVGADNRKRFEWPLGVVVELLPGRDGHVRVAKVKTARGILTRPLQRLYPLEVSQQQAFPVKKVHIEELTNKVEEDQHTTRSGRASKKPIRYGQWWHQVNSLTG